jgi:hypothetical protein
MSSDRKATDVLLDLEKKIDAILGIVRSQDLQLKILSNKLSDAASNMRNAPAASPKFTMEAVNVSKQVVQPLQSQQFLNLNDERQVAVSAENALPIELEPKGFSRTSRSDTYADEPIKYPIQMPSQNKHAEITVPIKAFQQQEPAVVKENQMQNAVPVSQRVVNSTGKSLFLADVELIDLTTMQQVHKTRTNGSGKWLASVVPGNYRIIISKLEMPSKQKLEATQDVMIDGSNSPYELQTIIIKS